MLNSLFSFLFSVINRINMPTAMTLSLLAACLLPNQFEYVFWVVFLRGSASFVSSPTQAIGAIGGSRVVIITQHGIYSYEWEGFHAREAES